MNNRVKVVVTGAAGQIGYATLFRLASGEVFGHNTDIELNLLELPQAMSSLEGVVMELDDCAFPLLKKISYTDDLNVAMDGVNWALLIGSVPRKQGMERSDLLSINGQIFTKQGKALNDRAANDVKILVVGNPCNTNAYIAKRIAKDIPGSQFFAMTALDELRAKTQLAKKANVDLKAISEMTIWGNHSATQFPDFYHAKINGKGAFSVINDETWCKEVFIPSVQQRGAAVIKARGASSAASAANAALHTVKQLIQTNTPEGDSFSVAISSNGQYGVDEGLMFSYPCRMQNGKLSVVEDIPFNIFAKDKFDLTLNELRQERDMVISLGLFNEK